MFIFKDLKLDIIVNILFKYKINSLTLVLSAFSDLILYIYYIIRRKSFIKSVISREEFITNKRSFITSGNNVYKDRQRVYNGL